MPPRKNPDAPLRRVLDRLEAAVLGVCRGVIDGGRGIKWHAAEIGIAHETLAHRLSPTNPDHIHQTRDLIAHVISEPEGGTILRELCRIGNHVAIPLPGLDSLEDGEGLHARMSEVAEEMGDVARKLREFTRRDSAGGAAIVGAELDVLEREADDVTVALRGLIEAARQQVRAASPAGRLAVVDLKAR